MDKLLGIGTALNTLFNVVLLLPWTALTVRRLHDTNKSGWWLVGPCAAFGLIAFVAVAGAMGLGAETSAHRSYTALIIGIVTGLAWFAAFLVFMVLPGTEGPNNYGPDPYGPGDLEAVFA